MSAQHVIDRIAEHVVNEGALVRSELRAGLVETRNAVRLQGSRAIPVLPTTGLQLSTSGGRLMGWTLRNSATGGQLTVDLRDGRDSSGELLATVSLGSASAWQNSPPMWFGPGGISFQEALYLDLTIVSGSPTLAGAVYVGAATLAGE